MEPRRCPAAAAPADDWHGSLEDEVGHEIYRELISDFAGHLLAKSGRLREAALAFDVPAARAVAHQIKGTALHFGTAHLDALADSFLQLDENEGSLLRPSSMR